MKAASIVALLLAVAGCSREQPQQAPVSTPLPTKQTTIDRAQQGLDAAQAESARQRAEAERATR